MKPKSNPFLASFRSTTLAISAVLSLVGICTQSARADATWVGDSTQDWNTAANWSSDPANPTGNFFINTSTAAVFPILSANSSFTPVDVILANGGTTTARFDHRAGTVSLANVSATGNWAFVGRGANTANGKYNLANTATTDAGISGFAQGSGSLTVGKLWVGGSKFFEGGTGTVNINTTGTITANSNQEFGNTLASIALGYGTGSSGTVNLQSGTIQANSELWVGFSGAGVFNQSGGTTNSTSYFVIGRNSGGNGTVNLSGGTINAVTTGGFTTLGSFAGATGTLNVSGTGSFVSSGNRAFVVGEGGTGVVNVSGSGLVTATHPTEGLRLGIGAAGSGTVQLDGGTILTTRISKALGTGTFNFNGGTLKASVGSATFMTGLTTATVQAGGAVIDSNGFDVTIGQDLNDGGGGLTKNGAGILSLAGANNYTGNTTVSTGTLSFTAKPSSVGNVSVANNASLGVQSFNAGTATLQSTALSLGSGGTSSLAFDLNSLNSTVPLISTGALTASGTVNVSILNGANLTPGAHTLVGYTSFAGGGTFSGSPFTLGTRSTGTVTNNTVAKTLTLTVTGDLPRWSGLDNGNWMVGTTGASSNWKLASGGTATNYIQGDTVLFNDLATGITDIVISAADVSPAATTFNNSSKNYTLGGAFAVAGTGPLIKSGTGSLVITNTNTYTGATTIDAGSTLTLGDGTTGHDGTIATTSGVTNDGTLSFNRFAASTAQYVISGAGAVNVAGSGTQTLSGANTYTGGTMVNGGGKVSVAGNANLGANEGTLLLDNGTLVTTAGFADAHPITIGTGGGTINVTTNGQLFMATAEMLLGSGTLNLIGGNGTLVANTGNLRVAQTNSFNGSVNVSNGGIFEYGTLGAVDAASAFTIGNEGEFALQGFGATALPNTITVSGGTNSVLSFENSGDAIYAAPVILNANAIVGLRNWYNYATVQNGTISGLISGAGGITVNSGTGNGGILTVSNASNTYAGGTTLNASRVLATTNSALGTGAVTIGGTNAQLELAGGLSVANTITINAGAGTAGQGIVWVPNLNDSAVVSGAITINAVQAAGGHFAANGGTLNVTGPITSSVPVGIRFGTVQLSNTTSTYTALSIIGGTGKVGATNAIPVGVTPTLGSGGVTGTLDLGGFNQTLAGITQSVNAGSGAIVTNTGGGDSTLTTTGTSTFAGVIQNGPTNKVALIVSSGALTLGGISTFTGNITVNGGLVLGDNAQLKFTPGPNTLTNSIGGNGTLNLDGDFVIDTAGASVANGNTWTLVNVGTLTETFSATFSVVGFTESANVWTKVEGSNTWTFSEATGVLSLSTGSTYGTWATTNAGGQASNLDFDNDGVKNGIEYFMGATGSSFTPSPSIVSGKITWPKDPAFSGTYSVQTSSDLVTWTNVLSTVVGNNVEYTVPTGQGKLFVRLNVVPN